MILKKVFIIFLLIASATLSGCLSDSGDQASGVSDFPNTLSALSQLAKHAVDSSQQWENIQEAEMDPSSIINTSGDAPKSARLKIMADTLALFDSLFWDYGDTANGTAIMITHAKLFGLWTFDTSVVVWDDSARDSVRNNETVIKKDGYILLDNQSQATTEYHHKDTDGDNVIDLVWSDLNSIDIDGNKNHMIWENGPGEDLNFENKEDNLLHFFSTLKENGADSLVWRYIEVQNQNGARLFSKNEDTTRLIFSSLTQLDWADPGFTRVFSEIHSITSQKDNFSFTERMIMEKIFTNGRTQNFVILKSNGDSSYAPEDSIIVRFTTTNPDPELIEKAQVDYLGQLGPLPSPYKTAKLISVSGNYTLRDTLFKSASFTIVPEINLTIGNGIELGTLDISATTLSDEKYRLLITLSTKGWTAVYREPKGDSFDIEWDEDGELSSIKNR